MVKEGDKWRRRLSGRVWVVDKVHEKGPMEIEIRLPETGEREAVSHQYLWKNFLRIHGQE